MSIAGTLRKLPMQSTNPSAALLPQSHRRRPSRAHLMGIKDPLYYLAVLSQACQRMCLCDAGCGQGDQTSKASKSSKAEAIRFDSTAYHSSEWDATIHAQPMASVQPGGSWHSGLDILLRAIGPSAASAEHHIHSNAEPATVSPLRQQQSALARTSRTGQPQAPDQRAPDCHSSELQITVAPQLLPAATLAGWDHVPENSWAKILPRLAVRDQMAFRLVCRDWHRAQSASVRSIRPNLLDVEATQRLFPMILALDLSACEKSSGGANSLVSLTSLTYLKSLTLNGWETADDESLWLLQSCSGLTTLRLAKCQRITGMGVTLLSRLPRLALLSLSECQGINDSALAGVSLAPSLTSLDISRCQQITDAGAAALTKMKNLMVLNIGGCPKVTDAGVACLARISSLASLRLAGCPLLTDSGLGCLARLRKLKRVNLAGCSMVSDAGLAELASLHVPTNINLAGCRWVTDAGVATLSRHLHTLSSLNLTYCKLVTDMALQRLSQLPGLRSLVVDGCRQIGDTGLASIARAQSLALLSLSGCTKVGDAGMASLSGLPALTHLDVTGCSRITGAGLASLVRLRLNYLDLTYCEGVPDSAVERLRLSHPNINIRTLDC